ncbi:MAG TPA: hypothetical protein V6C72_09735 [Chroococcales cyanobacterium]
MSRNVFMPVIASLVGLLSLAPFFAARAEEVSGRPDGQSVGWQSGSAQSDSAQSVSGQPAGGEDGPAAAANADGAPDLSGAFKLNARKSRAKGGIDQTPVVNLSVEECARVLSGYRVELIVDRSLSMAVRDCPGGLSRWQWCGNQAVELGRSLAPYSPDGLTITTFAWGRHVYENVQSSEVARIFAKNHFGPGTRMGEPLAERINNFLQQQSASSKPLLIGVITDGVPQPMYEPHLVSSTLIKASKKVIDPRLLTVVFLQVGGQDFLGRYLLSKLDHGVEHKAEYDIAHTISFKRLQQEGLGPSLVSAIQQFIGTSAVGP